jgi:hypothetical protein
MARRIAIGEELFIFKIKPRIGIVFPLSKMPLFLNAAPNPPKALSVDQT